MSDLTPGHVPDLDAYFRRIRYTGPRLPSLATLRALHLHHVLAIPFENLDVLLGRTIALDLPALERKLVHDRRGGYCYEQNTFFGAVLRALGFEVTQLIARVRWQVPPERGTPRSHMILRIDVNGEAWIVDVGFGSIGLTAPIRFTPDIEQPTPHEPRRLIRRGDYFVHQVRLDQDWHDVFQFTPDPVPAIDYEVANWFTNKHPQSHFQSNLIVARVVPEGRVVLFNREFTSRRTAGGVEKREVSSPEEVLAILATHFDLQFPAGTRFGPAGSPWPS
jgi:N-hydroxyarylamine O-acetyltransferase